MIFDYFLSVLTPKFFLLNESTSSAFSPISTQLENRQIFCQNNLKHIFAVNFQLFDWHMWQALSDTSLNVLNCLKSNLLWKRNPPTSHAITTKM